MDDLPHCPKCTSEYTYEDGNFYICPECNHEWSILEEKLPEKDSCIRDAVGNTLHNGDCVTVIKDLKVKGSSTSIKVGTKVKNIKLVEEVDGHDIDCKIPGFGAMMLKSSVVKKSN